MVSLLLANKFPLQPVNKNKEEYKKSKLYIHTINNKHKWNNNLHKINLGYQVCLHESP